MAETLNEYLARVSKLQKAHDQEEKKKFQTGFSEHEAKKEAQATRSKGDDGAGLFNLADEPTPFYGFTESEWNEKSDVYRRGVREWAYAQAGQFITVTESQAWTRYISDGNAAIVDSIYGPRYKYKSFFQSVQDVTNAKYFQTAEDEIDAITGARGYIQPGKTTSFPELQTKFRRDNNSYSGCDIIPSITVGGKTFVIGNLSAISYSVHRDKIPVRLLGRTYAKSYVSGGATIAGTLVFTVFDTHVLDEVRREVVTEVQAAGGQSSPLTQQLPPFDVTIFFQNEYGHASYMRIYGLEITDEAQTHTINDIYTENQMQYIARDIDLMCKANDQWTPQQAAFTNVTMFSKFNMATPAYKLQNKQANEALIGNLQVDVARINNEMNSIFVKLNELNKSTPSSEVTNLKNAYTIQLNKLQNEVAPKEAQIKSLQAKVTDISESTTGSDEYRLGSATSSGRDDPYALSRM